MKTAVVLEGGTRLVVPSASVGRDPPPTTPAFFNPAARLNRDVTVAFAAASGGRTFCDALGGVGARGVRVAREAGQEATVVDFNREALSLAKRSAALNRVAGKCRVVCSDSSAFLASRTGKDERYDAVDVDPFGTPAPFVTNALKATAPGGMVSFTATDAAVLCGVHPKVSERRYLARPLNNHFNHETGTRILIGAVARLAGSLDLGVVPVFSHATRHYFRVYLRVEVGATQADASVANLGYVVWGPGCGHVALSGEGSKTCADCGKGARAAGPMWTGRMSDPEAVRRAEREAEGRGLAKALRLLRGFEDLDSFPPWSFGLEEVSSSLGVPSVPRAGVVAALSALGFRCGIQPFEKEGLKTDAPYEEVVRACVEAAARS